MSAQQSTSPGQRSPEERRQRDELISAAEAASGWANTGSAMDHTGERVAEGSWAAKAAAADKSGKLMEMMIKRAKQEHALNEVANASKRGNLRPGQPGYVKPGWRLQERERQQLAIAVQSAKATGLIATAKLVAPQACERTMHALQAEGWLDARDQYGWTPLMHAAEANKLNHVATMMRAGADVNLRTTSEYGIFPAESSAVDICQIMQDFMGVDRKDIIEQLSYIPPSLTASAEQEALNAIRARSPDKLTGGGVLAKMKGLRKKAQTNLQVKNVFGYETSKAEDNTAIDTGTAPAISLADAMRGALRASRDKKQAEQNQQGISFATRTIHVGGIGKQWEENEAEITELFSRKFGPVLTSVLRYREPAEGKPHNSWALVTFAEQSSLERLMAGQETSHVQTADKEVTLVVRRIDPEKAMSSEGTFAKVFTECRERVEKSMSQAQGVEATGAKLPSWWQEGGSTPIKNAARSNKAADSITPELAEELAKVEAEAAAALAREQELERAHAAATPANIRSARAAEEAAQEHKELQQLRERLADAERRAAEMKARAVEMDAKALAAENDLKAYKEQSAMAGRADGYSAEQLQMLISSQVEAALGDAASGLLRSASGADSVAPEPKNVPDVTVDASKARNGKSRASRETLRPFGGVTSSATRTERTRRARQPGYQPRAANIQANLASNHTDSRTRSNTSSRRRNPPPPSPFSSSDSSDDEITDKTTRRNRREASYEAKTPMRMRNATVIPPQEASRLRASNAAKSEAEVENMIADQLESALSETAVSVLQSAKHEDATDTTRPSVNAAGLMSPSVTVVETEEHSAHPAHSGSPIVARVPAPVSAPTSETEPSTTAHSIAVKPPPLPQHSRADAVVAKSILKGGTEDALKSSAGQSSLASRNSHLGNRKTTSTSAEVGLNSTLARLKARQDGGRGRAKRPARPSSFFDSDSDDEP